MAATVSVMVVFEGMSEVLVRERYHKKKLQKFGYMSKLGLPYLPSSLVWTKISLNKYPTYRVSQKKRNIRFCAVFA